VFLGREGGREGGERGGAHSSEIFIINFNLHNYISSSHQGLFSRECSNMFLKV